jgi:prevent-host-death family protein
MDQAVGMVEAKSKLAELVGQVKYGGKRYILERRGRPMAMLISVDEFERLRASAASANAATDSSLPPGLVRRQEALLVRARRLRARLGPPEDRLAELLADLPPENDDSNEAAGKHGDTGNAVSTTRDSSMQFWIETDAN